MILKDFIKTTIHHNSIIRLLYQTKQGHITVLKNWDEVDMAWAITRPNTKYHKYQNHEVIHITSINSQKHPDAINIVIKEIPLETLRDNKLTTLIDDLPF